MDIPKKPFLFGIFASKPHAGWATISLIAIFVATGLDRLMVVFLRNLTDSLTAPTINWNIIWLWGLGYPSLHFVARILWRISGFSGMRWFMGLRTSAYGALYNYLSLHSKDYFNSRFAGALANKISHAVDGTEHLFEKSLWQFIPMFLGLIWYTIYAAVADLRLGAILLVWSMVFVGSNIFLAKKLQVYSYRFAKSLSTLKGRIVDSLSNISLVQEYAYIAGEREYIGGFVKKQYDAGLSHWWFSEWILVINGVLIFIFTLLMIGGSVLLLQNNLVTIGVVIMVLAMVTDLSHQFLFIGQEIKEAARLYGEASEGLDEILKEHLIVDAPNASNLKFLRGAISIESIDFDYENTKVFKNFSLEIPAGQKIGLVGRSGAGKSTFVSLLLRHFDVQSGEIRIDDQNIQNVTLESLRSVIAFVPQDTSLFHRTIRENIRYSNPQATDAKVRTAAKLAQAHEFIEKLPQGYDTLVGERGVKLSGGQRQRVAIARAFLKNVPILILDEATSSLDSESEHAIQISLEKLMKGRTVIAIAHRLSTLKKMDRLVIIENGEIAEDGSPDELLTKQEGIFKKMWDHQVKGFIVNQ
ncbi:MAG: ATP-binding cassette, subfamily B, bacterial [Microgenomates group bacterium Gr01-1014_7]|nr:MAG: ATP-binding cassette, subfamily B, bacterial [Microgenomates group bacterium Gr01-1014_7]